MYPYFLYPVGHVSSRYEGRLSPVSRVTRSQASREVMPSPAMQYGDVEQPQRTYAAQMASRLYLMNPTDAQQWESVSTYQPQAKTESAISPPVYMENMQNLLALRPSPPTVDSNYITNALERLATVAITG